MYMFLGKQNCMLNFWMLFLGFSYQALPRKTGWSLYLLPQNRSAVLPMRILFVCLFGTSLTCVLVTQLVWSGSLRSQQFHVLAPCWLLPWLFPWALPPTQAEEGWLQCKIKLWDSYPEKSVEKCLLILLDPFHLLDSTAGQKTVSPKALLFLPLLSPAGGWHRFGAL